jgi:hypothetical protein
VVTKLLETTALGRSRAMASALAEVGVADEPKRRDAALGLLRARQDLLSNEQAARVRLRDVDTCEAFDAAIAAETEVATNATKRDLERLALGECNAMLRVNRLCDACKGGRAAGTEKPPPRAGTAPDRGKGKGKGKNR